MNSFQYILNAVRTAGIVLMFWTNWPLALILLIIPQVIGYRSHGIKYQGREVKWGLIRSDVLKVLSELTIIPVSFYGIWSFPLLDPGMMHLIALLALILYIVYVAKFLASAIIGALRKLKNG